MKLKKALYGLKKATRFWHFKLDQSFSQVKLCKSLNDQDGVYIKHSEGKRQLVGVYVDDLIMNGTNLDFIGYFKEELMKWFKMTGLGLFGHLGYLGYLGIEVIQDEDWICLSQASCSKNILKIFKMNSRGEIS